MRISRRNLMGTTIAAGILAPGRAAISLPSQAENLPVAETARAVASGRTTIRSAALAAIARARANEPLNAFVRFDPALALDEARRAEAAMKVRASPHPLAGVPIVVKDNVDVKGTPTAAGTVALSLACASRDALIVERLKTAGAFVLGKTNMHELAAGGTSNNAVHGPVQNPRAPGHIAGGSSGGTAAAVAGGIVALGLGTDTAGSVRIPASLCGCVGYRPSLPGPGGDIWTDGVVPLSHDLDTIGLLGASVADVRNAASVIAMVPVRPSRGKLRIGLPSRDFWQGLDPLVETTARAALRRMEASGIEIVSVDTGTLFERAHAIFRTLTAATYPAHLDAYLQARGAPRLEQVVEEVRSADVAGLYRALMKVQIPEPALQATRTRLRPALIADYEATLAKAGVSSLIWPTVPVPAPRINERGDAPGDQVDVGGKARPLGMTIIRNSLVAPVLRAPAVSVPAGVTLDKRPVGLDFIAAPRQDAHLLAIAERVERALSQ